MTHEEEKTRKLQEVTRIGVDIFIYECVMHKLEPLGFKSSEGGGRECPSTKNWKSWEKSQRKTDWQETLKKGIIYF